MINIVSIVLINMLFTYREVNGTNYSEHARSWISGERACPGRVCKSLKLSKMAADQLRRLAPSLETDTILDIALLNDHCKIAERVYVTTVHRICDEKSERVSRIAETWDSYKTLYTWA